MTDAASFTSVLLGRAVRDRRHVVRADGPWRAYRGRAVRRVPTEARTTQRNAVTRSRVRWAVAILLGGWCWRVRLVPGLLMTRAILRRLPGSARRGSTSASDEPVDVDLRAVRHAHERTTPWRNGSAALRANAGSPIEPLRRTKPSSRCHGRSRRAWGSQVTRTIRLIDLFVAEQDHDRVSWRDLEADVTEDNRRIRRPSRNGVRLGGIVPSVRRSPRHGIVRRAGDRDLRDHGSSGMLRLPFYDATDRPRHPGRHR